MTFFYHFQKNEIVKKALLYSGHLTPGGGGPQQLTAQVIDRLISE